MGNKKNIGLPGGPNEIIIDSRGQWDNPGKNTRIPGNNITMKDVAYPVWAQPNVGPGTMMMPGSEHHFKNAEYVDEYPMAQEGGSVLPQAQRGFFSRPKIESKEETPEESYYNPKVEEDITSGDWKQDFLYNNQWLIDTPFIGDYLKDEARKVAEQSAGESRTEYDLKILDDPDSMYNQREDKSAKYSGWASIQDNADNRGEVSLMDQYFSEEALFPISPYKPTSDYLEFLPSYSIKGRMDEDRAGDQGYKDRLNSGLEMTIRHAFKKFIGQDGTDTEYTFEDITKSKEFTEFLKNKKTIFMTNDDEDDYKGENYQKDYLSDALSLDLGAHKTGIAWDEELNLPYISISDAWDFSPNHYSEKWSGTEETRQLSKIQASLMHKAGNPFKIYDRFYFDPESQKNSRGVSGIRYYTDAEIEQRKSKIPLDKKQDGTEIPDEAAVADDSFLYDLEKLVNKSLGDINNKAKNFSENNEELNNIDNMRHASGGRYAAEAIQQKVRDIPYVGGLLDFVGVDKAAGFVGANVMGIGHELRTIFGGDERPFLAKLQEMGEDTFNNYVGSIVGSLGIDDSKKDEVIRYLSYNNLLPDGYVRTEQGKKDGLSEDIYFKDPEGKRKTAYQSGGGTLPKAQEGLKAAKPSFPFPGNLQGADEKEFLTQWTNSPMGQSMLSESLNGNKKLIDRTTNKRINNLKSVNINIDDNIDYLGRYKSGPHSISMNSDLLQEGPFVLGSDFSSVLGHELSHAQDYSPGSDFNKLTIPLSDQKFINNLVKESVSANKEQLKKDGASKTSRKKSKRRFNYIGDPTETRARLNEIRSDYQGGKTEDMPSIFNSKVSPEMMDLMKGNSQFKELQEVYSDDQILELLNTISSTTNNNDMRGYAKFGGSLDKYQGTENSEVPPIELDPVLLTGKGRKKDTAFRDSDNDGNMLTRFLNVGKGKGMTQEELYADNGIFSRGMPQHMRTPSYLNPLEGEDATKLEGFGINPSPRTNEEYESAIDNYNLTFDRNYSYDNAYNEFQYEQNYKPEYDQMILDMHKAQTTGGLAAMSPLAIIAAIEVGIPAFALAGESAFAAAAPYVGPVLSQPLGAAFGMTSGPSVMQGINMAFAGDFILNRAPNMVEDFQEGRYGEGAVEAGFGVLDLAGAGVFNGSTKLARSLYGKISKESLRSKFLDIPIDQGARFTKDELRLFNELNDYGSIRKLAGGKLTPGTAEDFITTFEKMKNRTFQDATFTEVFGGRSMDDITDAYNQVKKDPDKWRELISKFKHPTESYPATLHANTAAQRAAERVADTRGATDNIVPQSNGSNINMADADNQALYPYSYEGQIDGVNYNIGAIQSNEIPELAGRLDMTVDQLMRSGYVRTTGTNMPTNVLSREELFIIENGWQNRFGDYGIPGRTDFGVGVTPRTSNRVIGPDGNSLIRESRPSRMNPEDLDPNPLDYDFMDDDAEAIRRYYQSTELPSSPSNIDPDLGVSTTDINRVNIGSEPYVFNPNDQAVIRRSLDEVLDTETRTFSMTEKDIYLRNLEGKLDANKWKKLLKSPKKLKEYILSNYPMHIGGRNEKVGSLMTDSFSGKKGVNTRVNEAIESTLPSGSVVTGSTNTSHNAYRTQLRQIFGDVNKTDKVAGKGKVVFLGYRPMNKLGFLSEQRKSNDEILKYLNTSIDLDIKNRKIIPRKNKNGKIIEIQRPFLQKADGPTINSPGGSYTPQIEQIMLPHYGLEMFKGGGELDKYQDKGEVKNTYNAFTDLDEISTERRNALTNEINFIVESQGGNQNLKDLLTMTAWMENSFGANPEAYNRDYTRGAMSIDDSAFKHMFEKRKGANDYTKGQKKYIKWFEGMGYDLDNMDKHLRNDLRANVAASRYQYGTNKDPLPSSKDPEALYNYYMSTYNRTGKNHHDRFMKGYKAFIENKKFGGSSDKYTSYKKYLVGGYIGNDKIKAEKNYDKLNRIHYRDAKQAGLSPQNYIMTNILGNS